LEVLIGCQNLNNETYAPHLIYWSSLSLSNYIKKFFKFTQQEEWLRKLVIKWMSRWAQVRPLQLEKKHLCNRVIQGY
jgi:hypothetical protein